jgi:hypothetical protein
MMTTNSKTTLSRPENVSSGDGEARLRKKKEFGMNDKDKILQTSSAAIVFFAVLSSTTALATALLPFFLTH